MTGCQVGGDIMVDTLAKFDIGASNVRGENLRGRRTH